MGVDIKCPCCKQEVEELDIQALLYLRLTDIQSDIVDKLVTDYPRLTRSEDLKAYVYAFREEPESNAIEVHLTRVRKKLVGTGWEISGNKAGRGNKAKYKLQKIEEPKK